MVWLDYLKCWSMWLQYGVIPEEGDEIILNPTTELNSFQDRIWIISVPSAGKHQPISHVL